MLPLLFGLTGCAIQRENIKLAPEEYLRIGENLDARGKHGRSQPIYSEMFGAYPRHPSAPTALMKAGDALFDSKSYDPAHVEYRLFYEFYPEHEDVEYVIYRMAESSFRKRLTHDRDPARTNRALREYRILLDDWPDSPYAPLARKQITLLRQELAEHQYYVARFYFRFDHYESAIQRIQSLIVDFPDYDELDKAYLMLGQAYAELDAPDEARETLQTLQVNFPESEYLARVEKALAKIEGP